MSADLLEPIRTALLASSQVTTRVAPFLNSFAIFTTTPAPKGAGFPMIMIPPQPMTTEDEDGVNDFRPIVSQEVNIFGANDKPGDVRIVNQLGLIIRTLFHRKGVLSVPGWSVIDVVVTGPSEAPIDEQASGVALQLRVRLAQLR